MRRFLTEKLNPAILPAAGACYGQRRVALRPWSKSMRHAIVALLVMTSTVTTVALAQDGGGHGPPRSVVVTVPSLPTMPVPTSGGSLSKLFQPNAELESMLDSMMK
jgi:hypothetical protein